MKTANSHFLCKNIKLQSEEVVHHVLTFLKIFLEIFSLKCLSSLVLVKLVSYVNIEIYNLWLVQINKWIIYYDGILNLNVIAMLNKASIFFNFAPPKGPIFICV